MSQFDIKWLVSSMYEVLNKYSSSSSSEEENAHGVSVLSNSSMDNRNSLLASR